MELINNCFKFLNACFKSSEQRALPNLLSLSVKKHTKSIMNSSTSYKLTTWCLRWLDEEVGHKFGRLESKNWIDSKICSVLQCSGRFRANCHLLRRCTFDWRRLLSFDPVYCFRNFNSCFSILYQHYKDLYLCFWPILSSPTSSRNGAFISSFNSLIRRLSAPWLFKYLSRRASLNLHLGLIFWKRTKDPASGFLNQTNGNIKSMLFHFF